MSALDELLAPGWRTGGGRRTAECTYTMADIGMAAFSLFFMQSPSFLAHQEALAADGGRSNCLTLFGMEKIPTDNHIRQMLDGNPSTVFGAMFFKALSVAEDAEGLKNFRRLGGRLLVALDGTEHSCSKKIHCPRCSQRKRSDGKIEYFHSFLGATVVAPSHARALPLPPEFITPQNGAEKQDCERAAAKRWLARHGSGRLATGLPGRRPLRLPSRWRVFGRDTWVSIPPMRVLQRAPAA